MIAISYTEYTYVGANTAPWREPSVGLSEPTIKVFQE